MSEQFKANPKRRANLAKLKEFLKAQPEGARLSWLEIELGSKVQMRTTYDKALLRRALDAIGREWLPITGSGIELSAPDNTLHLIRKKDERIRGALVRAGKADVRVQSHLDSMPQSARDEIILRSAVRNAVMTTGARVFKAAPKPKTLERPILPSNLKKI